MLEAKSAADAALFAFPKKILYLRPSSFVESGSQGGLLNSSHLVEDDFRSSHPAGSVNFAQEPQNCAKLSRIANGAVAYSP
jgi:hypothetical protein